MQRRALRTAGTTPPRIDGLEKVTGRAVYTGDVQAPGMAYGKALRSPYAHARVASIDAAEAEQLPGVVAVLTRDDLRDIRPYYGPAYRDQAIVAIDKVRYEGDVVAAVAATDEETAEAAVRLIRVEYEELPAVLSLDDALAPGAPLVHDRRAAAGNFPGYQFGQQKDAQPSNICHRYGFAKGDVEEGFREAALVFEDTFHFPRVHHGALEAHAAVAQVEGDQVTLWASAQDPFPLQQELAEMFGLPLSKVRVIVPYVGGGYGGKLFTKIEPLAVALARKAGCPVRVALSLEEAFKTVTRHSCRVHLRTGVSRDGRLIARECRVWLDTGAYADGGPRVAQKAGYRAPGPYRIPHVKTDAYAVYTNTVPAGAFRGFGAPQVAWAHECQMDIIAGRLGIDPLELRLKNLLDWGEEFAPGEAPVDCDLKAGLLRTAEAIGWHERSHKPNRGKGIACVLKDGGGTYQLASALVKVSPDGAVSLSTGSVELGQGTRTALAQIAAEELGVPLSRVTVAPLDTAATPFALGTSASSGITVMGLAVQRAAQDARRQLLAMAADTMELPPDQLELRDGRAHSKDGSVSLEEAMREHFGTKGGEVLGAGAYKSERSPDAPLGSQAIFWEVSWGGAEVEVDRGTGAVKVLKYVSVSDVGKAIHPLQCRGQDEGGAMFGFGHTLLEEMAYDESGQLLNPNLIDYRLPKFRDLPTQFQSILLESGNGPGPYGAKGMGEGSVLPVAPAIANAVARAVGVRIKDLPLTPEKVWRALQTEAGQKDR